VHFVDSKTNYLVQFADFVANTLVISYKKELEHISKEQIEHAKLNINYSNFPRERVKEEK
jgi:hypothetical protein